LLGLSSSGHLNLYPQLQRHLNQVQLLVLKVQQQRLSFHVHHALTLTVVFSGEHHNLNFSMFRFEPKS
jgi:hypothetical protein